MKKKNVVVVLLLFLICTINSLPAHAPKREFRGVWIATVVNLDWPGTPYQSTGNQQKDLLSLLDDLQRAGFNAIIFQVRDECDAFYASHFEPWSYYLTGAQGQAPEPFYDPLEFIIQEAHKRGMEVHAWFNPYRAEVELNHHYMAANHVTVLHPDWVFVKGTRKHLDPGLPMVRDYVASVIMDVVVNYDVDGIHFDDYFYPYDPIISEDVATFANYSRGFTNIEDWRRDNVNILIAQIYNDIQKVKPRVKFGISPFGIWKNGVPYGIIGFSAYDGIYCDALAWLEAHTVDYITPQVYWKIGGPQDFSSLVPWWASKTNGRHLYPGHAAYKINTWSRSEMPDQIRVTRRLANCSGSIFFRARNGVLDNPMGFLDSLTTNLYRYPALMPVMTWKDSIVPDAPQHVRYELLASTGRVGFTWNIPAAAADGDTASRYVVYRSTKAQIDATVLENPANIIHIGNMNNAFPEEPGAIGPFYYGVTALDRMANESVLSNVIMVTPPGPTQLVFPEHMAINQPDTMLLSWRSQNLVSSYHLQVSSDSTFSNVFFNETGIPDTFKILSGMTGQATYFWRVKSYNAGGFSGDSKIFNFTTGFPTVPLLVYPEHHLKEVDLNPALRWHPARGSEYYRVQVSTQSSFSSQSIKFDLSDITDTLVVLGSLDVKKIYYWRVLAENAYGMSGWTIPWWFRTKDTSDIDDVVELPKEFALLQNYPNPFNSVTKITYKLPESAVVELAIYNLSGQVVAMLVQEIQPAGEYSVDWNATQLSSGTYFYRLKAGEFVRAKKCMFLK